MKCSILCWLRNAPGFPELRFSSLEIFGSERRPPWWTHADPHRNTGYNAIGNMYLSLLIGFIETNDDFHAYAPKNSYVQCLCGTKSQNRHGLMCPQLDFLTRRDSCLRSSRLINRMNRLNSMKIM